MTMKVVVIRAHISEYPDPITFKSGDEVHLGDEDLEYPGWVRITTPGRQGRLGASCLSRGDRRPAKGDRHTRL